MPKSENQKLKLLYLAKILGEQTDENHPLTVAEMIKELEAYGICAERKSIYSDLEALQSFGLDIATQKSRGTGYFVASRTFELPELKLLTDAVASSKFITEKKSTQLIKKLETLASVHEAKQLHRQVYVLGRVKTENETIYYNVDVIHEAIGQNRKISFQYFEYTVDKEKHLRHGGKRYRVSPYALSWDDENYYMIGHYEEREGLTHFRVDKMLNIQLLEEKREELPQGMAFHLGDYSKKMFNMFAGEEQQIELQFDNSLIGVVIDRFGGDVPVVRVDENSFLIHITASVSPTFLAWVFSFGDRVRILSPKSLAERFQSMLQEQLSRYEDRC